jgi:CRISPR-associated protein Cas1
LKRLLNTLYVTTQDSYLCLEGETVLVRVESETRLRVPLLTLGGVVCFGRVSCSPPLMAACADRDVAISFLNQHGRFQAKVTGPVSGNVLLRRAQYRHADDPERRLEIARCVVLGKVANCRTVLLRAARDHGDKGGEFPLRQAACHLDRCLEEARCAADLDSLRGLEGIAAKTYFDVLDHAVTAQKEGFYLHERSRRPPLDNMNALLSFLYTILAHDVASALEAVGLDPQVGFLHCDRSGRPALALDIMEEFRSFLVDRLALSLVNLRQVQASGFTTAEAGGVVMDDETRKTVLVAYQKRKQEELWHPFLEETFALGLFVHAQAQLMARHIRGDLDAYPPFIWR